jgi:bifunctional UDP-N-acetylglucosamine pyrophosphorylase / glucosamine-1-phosphate N-acetyltransferase
MQTSRLNCVILAAGKGTRMVSKMAKIVHPIMGKPMVCHVVAAAHGLGVQRTIVVTGHEREAVEHVLRDEKVTFAVQTEQKGTAHALLATQAFLGDNDVLILYGDVPLIRSATLEAFVKFFQESDGIAFMATRVDRPDGYGRVVIGPEDEIMDIVEDSEATGDIRKIHVINTGICMIRHDLLSLVRAITPDNRKGEYYLTDICKIARNKGICVRAYLHDDPAEVLGINTRKELQEVNLLMRNRILDRHMESGVTIADRTAYIEGDVVIGRDTTVFPFSYITGKTEIGEDATIGPHVTIHDSVIGRGAAVESFAFLKGATVAEGARIGSHSRIEAATTEQSD